jgi:F0F1-type ATP synthase membrane subunit b/b'
MTIWWLAAILTGLGALGIAFIWLVVKLSSLGSLGKNNGVEEIVGAANNDVEHIFNDDFREELRNRGRLHFEKIIGENAMFLQQDLRLTTSQLNDYMKQELTSKLREEFAKYEESITDAKQMAIDSIEKTKETIEEERQQLLKQLDMEVAAEKNRLVNRFEENMADIVNHYVLAAIGKQIDLSDQLEYIISELEANKQAITEDIKYGA